MASNQQDHGERRRADDDHRERRAGEAEGAVQRHVQHLDRRRVETQQQHGAAGNRCESEQTSAYDAERSRDVTHQTVPVQFRRRLPRRNRGFPSLLAASDLRITPPAGI